MTYAICIRGGKPQLVKYHYNWSGNRFYYIFGTSDREFWDYDALPFKIIAELWFDQKYTKQYPHTEYPVDNTLSIRVKPNTEFKMTIEEIFALKGFKKFFDGKNIKKIEIVKL